MCAHIDKGDGMISCYEYIRTTKELTKVDYSPLEGNPYSNHILLLLSTTVQIVYKFSTKKGRETLASSPSIFGSLLFMII